MEIRRQVRNDMGFYAFSFENIHLKTDFMRSFMNTNIMMAKKLYHIKYDLRVLFT